MPKFIEKRLGRISTLICLLSTLWAVGAHASTNLTLGVEPVVNCSSEFAWGCNFLGSPARTSAFSIPNTTGYAQLQSWTISPDPGIGLDGVYSYVYRVSLKGVTLDPSVPKGTTACIDSLTVPFGRVLEPYDGTPAVSFDAYRLSRSYGGNIDPSSAVQTESSITFTFPPVCAGNAPFSGDSTTVFGVTSTCAAQTQTADVTDDSGNTYTLAARIPAATGVEYVWPLSGCATDEDRETMGTSFGPRINNDEWDFHNGIDMPAEEGVDVPVYAARAGRVVKAGDGGTNGMISRHVIIEEFGPNPKRMVYLHLDSIDSSLPALYPDPANPSAPATEVHQGQQIGLAGEDGSASHKHLHFEIREGTSEIDSVHPMKYLPYEDSANFTAPVLEGLGLWNGSMAARLLFEAASREEGDLMKVEVDLLGSGGTVLETRAIDFDDTTTFSQENDDDCAFTNDIALEGYQSADMKGDGRTDLKYGIVVRNLQPTVTDLQARVFDVAGNMVQSSVISIPSHTLFQHAADFESVTPPALPSGWSPFVTPLATVETAIGAGRNGSVGLVSTDLNTHGDRDKASMQILPLETGRFEWFAEGWFNPKALELQEKNLYALHFLNGSTLSVSAIIRQINDPMDPDDWQAAILARNSDTLTWPLDIGEGPDADVALNTWKRWSLHVKRLGTREAGAILYLDGVKVATESWDTSVFVPDTFRVGIGNTTVDATATIWSDDILLTEDTPSATASCPVTP